MKTVPSLRNLKTACLIFSGLFLLIQLTAQDHSIINGFVRDYQKKQPVEFATASLHYCDSSLYKGTVTDQSGRFTLQDIEPGDYLFRVNYIGYNTSFNRVSLKKGEVRDLDTLYLLQETIEINEATIVGERLKAKRESGKTTYFINNKLKEVSRSGVDILGNIPGVKIDLMQNLSLEGSQKIKILVNGKERSLDFLKQLEPEQIDKIEVISQAGMEFDSETGGVINIVLAERETGISGTINAEIPSNPSEVYAFPSFNLGYGRKKFSIFSSWNGEFSYFDIDNIDEGTLLTERETLEFRSVQKVSQKDWSHRFHLGFDYSANPENEFGFYGYYNPFSWEQDGRSEFIQKIEETILKYAAGRKEDRDRNHRAYLSAYYTHHFGREGQELKLEVDHYRLKAENEVLFSFDSIYGFSSGDISEHIEPFQERTSFRADFQTPLTNILGLETGIKGVRRNMEDLQNRNFRQKELHLALYSGFSWTTSLVQLKAGARTESRNYLRKDMHDYHWLSLLPFLSAQIKPGDRQDLSFSFRRSSIPPAIYHLNPGTSRQGPNWIHQGNPMLQPMVSNSFTLDHSIRPGKNFLSCGLSYKKTLDYRSKLYTLSKDGTIESIYQNMGNLHEIGVKVSGSWKIGSFLSLNHYTRLIKWKLIPLTAYEIPESIKFPEYGLETSISAIAAFNNKFSLSLQFQYSSPLPEFQRNIYEDPIYFICLNKSFGDRVNLGITFALPFTGDFVYYGEDIRTPELDLESKGIIHFTQMPVWFSLKYSFHSGRKVESGSLGRGEFSDGRKKGF